ncbi:uncharacterized protein LOC133531825 [Cydia pomonella]|uniref:uncharacterized protein LOC133531825 n=1 Tax=Cydia pomonella TaxID=82600 RepID=UPI002ADE936B|nr:uncharacterized protein LOC133531825 [Cydia pomonella]
MAFKVVLCVIAVLGQSFAAPSSCGCSQDFSPPVYSSDGVVISEIDYQPSYKPISISFSEKDTQSSYKPISVRVEKESYNPIYHVSTSAKESYKSRSKPTYVRVSENESYKSNKPVFVPSLDVPSNGGTFLVTSVGTIVPSGIGVATDLSLGGELEVSGVLPYLSAVAFEGQFDANGAAAVEYGCGDCVAITEEIRGNPNFNPLVSGKY